LTLLAGAATALWSAPASACGGFFCSQQQPVNQAAERIIFADNGDGTITAVIQILYQGPSENFSWLLPISSVPEGDQLGVASDIAFSRLQFATNPQFNLTQTVEGQCRTEGSRADSAAAAPVRETCDDNPLLGGCALPDEDINGSPINVEASGVVGAFDYTVISVDPGQADPVAPAREWLDANGYDVTPEGAALMQPYLAEGMHLLALRLTKGSDTGSIRPIKITYAADAPMIPIKLTAVAANSDMGVMTWALSSARAVPMNYNALELNEARINWFNAASNYNQVVTEAADAAGGQGFVTEFAGPSSQLANVVWQPFEETDWQNVKNATYSSFDDLFQALFQRYQTWSGFWDAVRRSVTLDEALSFDDFQRCPACYSASISFSPTELLAAIESDVIDPLRSVQALIDRAPYATRLYSTLSAAEMTVDPVFVFNPDLGDVDNIHQATQVIECDRSVYQFEAPWRIDFPQGTTIRGTPDTLGQWPDATNDTPPNFRVLQLAAAGEGEVVADNSEQIGTLLQAYNDGIPSGSASLDRGACSLTSVGRTAPSPALPVGLMGLLGVAAWRRRGRRG
jgi:MYXO-CTERM domain-containing protein